MTNVQKMEWLEKFFAGITEEGLGKLSEDQLSLLADIRAMWMNERSPVSVSIMWEVASRLNRKLSAISVIKAAKPVKKK